MLGTQFTCCCFSFFTSSSNRCNSFSLNSQLSRALLYSCMGGYKQQQNDYDHTIYMHTINRAVIYFVILNLLSYFSYSRGQHVFMVQFL